MRRLAALVLALLAALVAWLIAIAPAEAASGESPTLKHTYNNPDHLAPSLVTTERGPPATYDRHNTYNAVGRSSHGASASPP